MSVWCQFMFGQTNLSGRDLSNMFERSLPDKLSVVCRLYVGVVSVFSGSVRGRVGLNSATDGRWFVGIRSVMYRAYVGRHDTDSRPIQDRMKSDITPNCVESADTFPNQNRRVPDISRTQTECKLITVCGVIPTYKSTQKIPENISSSKWHHEMAFRSLPQPNQILILRYHIDHHHRQLYPTSTIPFPILGPRQYGHHFAYDILKYNFYENLCNSIETSLEFVHKDPMNNMPAFVQLASMSFKYIFFKFMITNKISPEMSLQGNLPFFFFFFFFFFTILWYHEHVYTNTVYSYLSTFYVAGSLYIHLIMPTCFILLRFTPIDIWQHWRNKDSYHHYHLWTHCGWLTHTCVRNLTWHSLW